MMIRFWQVLCAVTLAASLTAAPVRAQSCSDGNECTNNDMCSGGDCNGTPVVGACDDANPCTINDTCVSGTCQGTPNTDAVCGQTGCEGTCSAQGFCLPDVEKQGESCTDPFSTCTTDDVCVGTICIGDFVICPDGDSNKCTLDFCNVASGQCQTFPVSPCGECESCNAEDGSCSPLNGGSCEDGNVCTGDGTCANGSCVAGAPVTPGEDTATPTTTPTGTPAGTVATETATATATVTVTNTPPVQVPTDTATQGPVDTATATVTPTGLPTGTATATATVTATINPTDTATQGPVETATFTPTGLPTGTATATATVTATGLPTGTATATATATGIPTGTATATATPTTPSGNTATATATRTPTVPPITSTPTATNTSLPVVASILVGSATGEPGTTIDVSVSLDTTAQVAGTQNDIAFDPKARIAAKENGKPDCTVNPEIDKGGTSFAFQPSGCTPGTDCTSVRALVLALDNVDPIADGAVLYTCKIAIAADATGDVPLPCSNPGAGDPDGERLGVDCTGGTITIAVDADATITIGSINGAAGTTQTLSVTLNTEVDVAGTQNDITFPEGIEILAKANGRPDCTVNLDIEKGGTSFAFQPSGCTAGTDCTGVRALVLALDNVSPIPNGSVLYTCQMAIGEGVADDTYPIVCTNAGASDPDGGALVTNCVNGSAIVGVIVDPTDTPTETATVTNTPTPTATPTIGTPTTPTNTATGTPTATKTRKPKNDEDDGCAVVAPRDGGAGWALLLPIAGLLLLRRRRS